MATLFFSYSHADEALRDQLEKQLSLLKRQGVIETWHDRRIGAGEELDPAISAHVETDDIILLLISADFLASDYCYDREMLRAMERHATGEATVIPVILRACDWHGAPFGKLMAAPTDGRPITQWPDRDQAFLEVTRAVRGVVERMGARATPQAVQTKSAAAIGQGGAIAIPPGPRSSNLRVTKEFSERERDRFKVETFDYIARFVEGSLDELAKRNPGIEGDFRRADANRFTAAIYKDGSAIAKCTIFMGGERFFGSGIAFVHGETTASNSYNETLSVEADDQTMFLTISGMSRLRGHETKLSQEGAAEAYWSMLIEPLQRTRGR